MFDDLLIQEAFSNASYMDVRELRALYYGRLNIYVSFTDNSEYETRDKNRPDGIVAHAVDTVVGRKANTALFYGKVFRLDKSGGKFVEDIRLYTTENLQEDIAALYSLSSLKTLDIDEAVSDVLSNGRLRRPFDRLWEITKKLSDGDGKKWQKLFLKLDYIGFADQSGLGVITKKKYPVMILIDTSSKKDLDIVPVQKYRKDERLRVRELVDYRVRTTATPRNRIAKQKVVSREREKKPSSTLIKTIHDLISMGGGL